MTLADHIRKRGFRHWHERQLIEAHASLVTAFLAVIVIAVCLDQLRWRDAGAKPWIMLALAIAGVALCFKTVTFYFKALLRAEHFAQQAVCGQCKTYGILDVTRRAGENAATDRERLHVRCRKCGYGWTMAEVSENQPRHKAL